MLTIPRTITMQIMWWTPLPCMPPTMKNPQSHLGLFSIQVETDKIERIYCQTPDLGQGLEFDFTFAV